MWEKLIIMRRKKFFFYWKYLQYFFSWGNENEFFEWFRVAKCQLFMDKNLWECCAANCEILMVVFSVLVCKVFNYMGDVDNFWEIFLKNLNFYTSKMACKTLINIFPRFNFDSKLFSPFESSKFTIKNTIYGLLNAKWSLISHLWKCSNFNQKKFLKRLSKMVVYQANNQRITKSFQNIFITPLIIKNTLIIWSIRDYTLNR